jgi:hypothetical protein
MNWAEVTLSVAFALPAPRAMPVRTARERIPGNLGTISKDVFIISSFWLNLTQIYGKADLYDKNIRLKIIYKWIHKGII